ncbi:MAG: hypothetical protein KJ072_03820 [Verrucomicrobia bacterium]|nr:hypothetical protein [Verrucomicrobiota bacterium]
MRRFPRGGLIGAALVRLTGWLLAGLVIASAHETDNFCLPLDSELADLGDYLEAAHTIALEEAVAEINARIERALRIKSETGRARRLVALHDPQTLAETFRWRFSHPLVEDSQLERALRGRWAREAYAGREASHQDFGLHFSAYAPLDPRRWTTLTQSRTIKACGVYFGTDKLVHFHRLGLAYYCRYRALIKTGLSEVAAYQQVLEKYSRDGFLSEEALFGTFSTGVYSNADLAVNHIGFKFFLNLTEKVVLNGREQEPLVVRCGVFWRINRRVHLRSGWFAVFVSDHWNEALNPSRYQPSLRAGIRRALQNRAREIVQFYTRKDGRPEDPDYYDDLARELATYHGEPYGHSGQFEDLMTIGNTCIPALRGAERGRAE